MTDDAMTTHMFGSATPVPQTTAGEAVTCPDCKGRGRWSFSDGGDVCLKCGGMGTIKRPHPTPAAAATSNEALETIAAALNALADQLVAGREIRPSVTGLRCMAAALSAALARRPAEATSREAVSEAARLRALLARAESFISGFEGDASQNGVDELLRDIRAGVASC